MAPENLTSRRCLQAAILTGGLVPIVGGLGGVLDGPYMIASLSAPVSIDSHWRYLSGLLLAIGVSFWSTVPQIERKGERFRLLTGLVVTGGLGRLVSLIAVGQPSLLMIFALAMELAVTPALAFWQSRIATRSA